MDKTLSHQFLANSLHPPQIRSQMQHVLLHTQSQSRALFLLGCICLNPLDATVTPSEMAAALLTSLHGAIYLWSICAAQSLMGKGRGGGGGGGDSP